MDADDYLTEAEQDEIRAVLRREIIISNHILLKLALTLAECNLSIIKIVRSSKMDKTDQDEVQRLLAVGFENAIELFPKELRDIREKVSEKVKNGDDDSRA